MATINYENKEALNVNPTIPNKNKVVDSDMNLIKQVGNQILTTMGVYTDNWTSSATYNVGEIAIYDNRIFKNLTGTNTATTPDEDTTNWEETTLASMSGGGGVTGDTLPIGSEVDFDGQEVPAGWEETTDPNEYSTSEIVIGKWIDNKPLYRKTYYISALGNATSVMQPLNISNLEDIVSIKGVASNSQNFFILPSYRGNDDTIGIQIIVDINSGITITTGNDRTGYHAFVTIEYTKSTD